MKPGDLVVMHAGNGVRSGDTVRVVSPGDNREADSYRDFPAGTSAIILEIFESHRDDGPSMESYALVVVEDFIGYAWLYQCSIISKTTGGEDATR